MITSRTKIRIRHLVLLGGVILGSPAVALETPTHVLVNRQAVLAVTSFDLEAVLRNSLDLREGSETRLAASFGESRRVREWFELGGELEDQGSILARVGRFYRHFHDPLKSWDTAGLTATGLGQSESSVRWMQNRRQTLTGAAGGNWSWHDARRMYYQALIEPDPQRRDALMAATFRALGQIMHLVVDASNPDHARNDPHPLPSVPLLGILFWNYDKSIESRHGRAGSEDEQAFVRRYLSTPIGFDRAIFRFPSQTGEELATVPISRLIDADVYTGANPEATFDAADSSAPVAIGIGEVSNANFFSENTLDGPYPNPPTGTEGLIRTELELPRRTPGGLNLVRRYWSRPAGQGLLPANPLRAECAGSRNPRSATPPYPCVDGVVWDQVAAHMLPRAVGYARGVLEYFFRGRIRVNQVVPRLTGVFIDIENDSDEPLEGVFEVHARDARATSAETRRLFSLVNDGQPVSLQPGESGSFSMPATAAPAAYHVLVFRGRLGLEEEAVIGQVFAVPTARIEPESYDADVDRTCTLRVSRPTSSTPLREALTCAWRAINHRFVVGIRTNYGEPDVAGASGPAIERIAASWEGAVGGPAPLTVNGEQFPEGIWQRAGSGPDPRGFTVFDPTARGDSRLRVVVTVRGGPTMSTLIPILREMVQEPWKMVSRPHTGWRITAQHVTVIQPNVTPTTPFVADVVGGYPYPTSISRPGESISVTHGAVGNRFASHRITTFQQDVMTGTFTEVEAIYHGIELTLRPFPSAPDVDFSAELTPRPMGELELKFWNTFVAPGPPPAFSYVLRAHEPGSQEAP